MKKLFISLILFLLILVIAFFVWRRKAPSYNGQDLHANVAVEGPVELLLMGDMGSGDEHQERIAEAMNTYCQTHPLAGVIFLGDNFYPKGVESADDEQWQSKFMKPYGRDCLQKVPFYALLGNHDYKGNPAAQIEHRSTNPSWTMLHRFYDIRFGNILNLTMLDTNILDICGFSSYCTLDFLRTSLAESNARFNIVLGHHPVASSSGKYARNFQGVFFERFLCDRAHYYIAGHSHHLEHLKSGTCKTPLDLFVVGGGGADLYEVKTWQKETQFAESTWGFMSLRADQDKLTFAFYDGDLKKLYETTKTKDQENEATEKPPTN